MVCRVATGVLMLLALSACGCSNHTSLTRDDVRSEVFSANSYASETEMFIDYIRAGHATRRFAEAHAWLLSQEIRRSVDELSHSTPPPETAPVFATCKDQLELLQRELAVIPNLMGNHAALISERRKIAQMSEHLSAVSSSL